MSSDLTGGVDGPPPFSGYKFHVCLGKLRSLSFSLVASDKVVNIEDCVLTSALYQVLR